VSLNNRRHDLPHYFCVTALPQTLRTIGYYVVDTKFPYVQDKYPRTSVRG